MTAARRELPDTTPGEVIAACELLLPLAEELAERCPDVWSAEPAALLRFLGEVARSTVQ